jgi:YrbI family 3-deoxy-D-manno-octulosonate 8-phosphate phosphatase
LVFFDFDGVFTDNTVYVSQDGIETVRCWRSDGLGLTRLLNTGVNIQIISTERNPVVMVRAQKLKIPCLHGINDKSDAVLTLCKKLNVDLLDTMFVGNDINDIPAFNIVGVPVAVADAYPETYEHVIYITKKPGGYGAVREVCDLIYFAKLDKSKEENAHAL